MKTIRVPAMVALLVFTVAPVFAQVSGALLSGTVTDPSGAAVSRAQVVIRNVSTGIERTAVRYKNTAFLSDRFTTQFRVEFFNVLNHTNFQGPLSNNVLFDQTGAPVAGAGALTQTTHDSREIQIALKLLW
jgi:hypothetical protein